MLTLRQHTFQLRPKCRICIELPDDFTADEARRLEMFISSLPIGEMEDNRGNNQELNKKE
jgi:hypothetical protein